jgi:CLIP-associating protein 1/2
MTALVQIRRTHHLFPIRPYLSLLLDSLEDSDPSVRECAKTSVVELFTGPGVTDGARADLKKEMTKKNVRKQIAEAVIGQVAARSSASVTPAAISETYEDDQFEASAPDNALPKRRPPLGAASTGAVPRIASGSGFMPRPQSRTASTSSILPATVAALPPTDTADVKVVYVSTGCHIAMPNANTCYRLLPNETWRLSLQVLWGPSTAKNRS